jgi:hypothetical protein
MPKNACREKRPPDQGLSRADHYADENVWHRSHGRDNVPFSTHSAAILISPAIYNRVVAAGLGAAIIQPIRRKKSSFGAQRFEGERKDAR